MRTPYIIAVVCLSMVLVAALASAATCSEGTPKPGEAPIVTSPVNGAQVGPSTLVVGKAVPGSLVVIQTKVFDIKDGVEFSRMVPGHRHRTNDDGSFALLISTPRAFFSSESSVRYEIHVFTATREGQSPHRIIKVTQKPE